MRKSGFTLIELLVYMAIMGFIIVVAGRVFSDSTVMRVRSQNMIKTAEQVGNAANLITEDISQMGVKTWAYSSASSYVISTKEDVYILKKPSMDPMDSSSFELYRGATKVTSGACGGIINEATDFDSLLFRRAEFETAGPGNDSKVMEVAWAVNDKCELHRSCQTISGTEDEGCPEDKPASVLIAKNIRKFSLYASAPGVPQPGTGNLQALSPDTVFPTASNSKFNLFSPEASGNALQKVSVESVNDETTASVSGLSRIKNTGNASSYAELYLVPVGGDIPECYDVQIKKGETWVVEFNMPFSSGTTSDKQDSISTQFLPGKDHIAVGLRYNDRTGTDDFSSKDVLFYPSQEQTAAVRYAEFFAKADPATGKKVCVALTLSFYSPLASEGTYYFSNFKIYRKPTGAYHSVKKDNGYEDGFAKVYATESDPNKVKHKKRVKAFELLLEIDQNGEVAGTYSQGAANAGIAIPVPNNGGI